MSAVGQKGACNDHSVRDFEIPLPSYSDQEWGQTGFRFVKIELCEQDAGISLKSALAVFIYRDLEYKGSFRCSDEKSIKYTTPPPTPATSIFSTWCGTA